VVCPEHVFCAQHFCSKHEVRGVEGNAPNEPPLPVLFAQVIVLGDPEQAAALVAALKVLPCLLPSDVEAGAAVRQHSPAAESRDAASCPAGQATPANTVNCGGSEGRRC